MTSVSTEETQVRRETMIDIEQVDVMLDVPLDCRPEVQTHLDGLLISWCERPAGATYKEPDTYPACFEIDMDEVTEEWTIRRVYTVMTPEQQLKRELGMRWVENCGLRDRIRDLKKELKEQKSDLGAQDSSLKYMVAEIKALKERPQGGMISQQHEIDELDGHLGRLRTSNLALLDREIDLAAQVEAHKEVRDQLSTDLMELIHWAADYADHFPVAIHLTNKLKKLKNAVEKS